MPSFSGKVVIITGASSGIGAATAEHLAQLGASLALCGRNVENLTKIQTKCIATGKCPKPLMILCDVNDEKCTKNIFDSTVDAFGKIDVLVNNAGIATRDGIDTLTMEKFDNIITTNLRSVIRLTQEAVPHLIKTKGNIVNVSSFLGLRPSSTMLSYAISKAALDQFTQCLALELAPKGVRVNSANPGFVITDIHRRAGIEGEAYAKLVEYNNTIHPLGRVGQPHEVASVIAFLASDDSSFMTGALLPIDGGKHTTTLK